MKLPPPERGSIIRYSYLWADEQRQGRYEGSKDRPVLVLALSVIEQNGQLNVLVLPVTHSPPADLKDAVEIPTETKQMLRLDGQRSWIVTTEANAFVWPGPDIRPIPGGRESTIYYGRIPPKLLQRVAQSYLDNRKLRRSINVARTS